MTVALTATDIAHGTPKSQTHCPTARAIRRRYRTTVYVGSASALIGSGARAVFVRLPVPVRRFISRFDTGQPVQPFSFRLQE